MEVCNCNKKTVHIGLFERYMKKSTSVHMFHDQYLIAKIRQIRSYHALP